VETIRGHQPNCRSFLRSVRPGQHVELRQSIDLAVLVNRSAASNIPAIPRANRRGRRLTWYLRLPALPLLIMIVQEEERPVGGNRRFTYSIATVWKAFTLQPEKLA